MSKDYEDLPEWEVTYIDPADGETYSIEVRAKDEAYAEEVAREELTAESPATDTDEWEILAVTRLDAPSLVPTLH